jgi:hypothetical protein
MIRFGIVQFTDLGITIIIGHIITLIGIIITTILFLLTIEEHIMQPKILGEMCEPIRI